MKKYSWNWKIALKNAIFLISILIISWFIISLIEIMIKNTGINPVYSNHNLFKAILRYKGLLP